MPTITNLVFPFVKMFFDYHEIDALRENLSSLHLTSLGYEDGVQVHAPVRIHSKELTVEDSGRYWGLFWVHGHKPPKKEIEQLLRAEQSK